MVNVKGAVALGLVAVAALGAGVMLVSSDPPQRPASPRQVVAQAPAHPCGHSARACRR